MILMPINSWSQFKSTVITNKKLKIQYTEDSTRYDVYAQENGIFMWNIVILKNGGAEVVDFEANYKPTANAPINAFKVLGATDNTQIGNVGDALKTVQVSAAGAYTTFNSSTEVVLGATYTTLHSVSGSGLFVGATFVIDNPAASCRVQLDGQTVFEFTGNFLSEVVNKDADFRASGIFGVTNDGKRLYFTPNNPIPYMSSLVFSAKELGKKVKYQLYTYSVN